VKFTTPLLSGRLVRRYKRFLADVILDGYEEAITCAVPNTGSMMGLTTPGSKVWLSTSANPKRKYPHTLEIVEADGTMVGINTGLPNRIAEEAIHSGMIADIAGYAELKREQKYGRNSRIDILLRDPLRGLAYVEVKNVHMTRAAGLAEFPDSVTSRGARHLDELSDMVAAGHRAMMVYLVQRADCDRLKLCRDLDPAYCAAFDRAMANGVEAVAIQCQITENEILPARTIPIDE
jgi:sugar fermentation stimulation protein A